MLGPEFKGTCSCFFSFCYAAQIHGNLQTAKDKLSYINFTGYSDWNYCRGPCPIADITNAI